MEVRRAGRTPGLTGPVLTWALFLAVAGAGLDACARPARLSLVTVEYAWPEFRGSVTERDPDWLGQFEAALAGAARRRGDPDPWFAYWRVRVERDARRSTLLVSREYELYSPAAGEFLSHPALAGLLAGPTRRLAEGFFGEALRWPHPVDLLWPRGSHAVLQDLETRLTLRVRRRGGYHHVDAEPLTASDTAVLREIYGGELKWWRRAVILLVGGRRIAASMNGMPHGGEVILDNDFKGHFCVHFAGSRLHATGEPDRGHRLGVAKASGRLLELLDGASAEELAEWVLVGLTYRDRVTVRHATSGFDEAAWEKLTRSFRHLEVGTPEAGGAPGTVAVDVTIYAGERKEGIKRRLDLSVGRPDGATGWKVDFESLLPLLEPAGPEDVPALGPPDPGC